MKNHPQQSSKGTIQFIEELVAKSFVKARLVILHDSDVIIMEDGYRELCRKDESDSSFGKSFHLESAAVQKPTKIPMLTSKPDRVASHILFAISGGILHLIVIEKDGMPHYSIHSGSYEIFIVGTSYEGLDHE